MEAVWGLRPEGSKSYGIGKGQDPEREVADMQEKKEQRQEMGIARKFTGKLSKDNFLIVILVGILLLVIVWPVEDKKTKTQSEQWDSGADIIKLQSDTGGRTADPDAAYEGELISYAAMLEHSLEELLATMDGVGRVRVMVTLEGSGVSVVEKDQSRERNSVDETDSAGGSRKTMDTGFSEETVFDKRQGSSAGPYVKQVLAPKVEGVAVSAQGGGDAGIVRNITEAIQALFGIEAHKIKIVKMIP